MSEKTLTDHELEVLTNAQAAEIEAKTALADEELLHHERRKGLLRTATEAAEARRRAFDSVMLIRGMDPEKHDVDWETGTIREKPSGLAIRATHRDAPTVPPPRRISEDDLDALRGLAVKVSEGDES